MQKIITCILIILFFVCLCLIGFSQNDGISRNRGLVIKAYISQIGVREKTGNNDGRDVEKFLATVGLKKGFPWCAAFVKWCFLKGGVTEANVITGMALSTENNKRMLYKSRTFYGTIKSADVFTLYYKKLNRIGHTGFFHKWANRNAGTIVTVEGNTSSGGSREGNGVYMRIRQIGGVYSVSSWIND